MHHNIPPTPKAILLDEPPEMDVFFFFSHGRQQFACLAIGGQCRIASRNLFPFIHSSSRCAGVLTLPPNHAGL